jgi:tetratricopeptide (TPR) repeat protein
MTTQTLTNEMFNEGALEFTRGNFDMSINHFAKAIEHDPKSFLAYLSRGVAYGKMGKFDMAIADFDRVIELHPNHARVYHLRGLVYLSKGEHQRAVEDFDRAIELNPSYGAAYYSRGTTHAELGNEDRAGKDMTMAARLGEANLQAFSDQHNVWRTKYDKVEAEVMGDRERDWGVNADLRSFLDSEN